MSSHRGPTIAARVMLAFRRVLVWLCRSLAVAAARPEIPGRQQHAVQVLLAELRSMLKAHLDAGDALDSKAGMIFGATSSVAALTTVAYGMAAQSATTGCSWVQAAVRADLVLNLVVSVAVIYCLVQATRVAGYHLPLEPGEIEDYYLELPRQDLAEQLLANYIECCQWNTAIIATKARWVDGSVRLLAANVTFLMILIAIGMLK